MKLSNKNLLFIAFLLLLMGVVLPFLMVIKVFENSFFLSFLSYAASISGLVLGSIAAMMMSISRKKK
jgi:hypothetical protein